MYSAFFVVHQFVKKGLLFLSLLEKDSIFPLLKMLLYLLLPSPSPALLLTVYLLQLPTGCAFTICGGLLLSSFFVYVSVSYSTNV